MSSDDLTSAIAQPSGREQRALQQAQQWVTGDVAGVGLGQTEDGEPCILVYLTRPGSAAATALPDAVEGLPVTVVPAEAFSAQDD